MTDETLPKEGILSHLIELRSRILRAFLSVIVVFFALTPFASDIYQLLAQPILRALPDSGGMVAIGIITPFWIPIKTTFFAAFIICLPYVFFQLWRFVAPGLYQNERGLVFPLIVSSTLLFFAGILFAYFFVFRFVFTFVAQYAPESIAVTPDIEQYLSFVMTLFITFGFCFEVPIVVYLLVRSGIVDIATLRAARPYVIVGAVVVAAIITPPDVLSQLLLAIPSYLLYEVGLLFAARAKPSKDEDDEAPPQSD